MKELDKLIACIEDGHLLAAIQTEDDLREAFAHSQTGIAEMFEGGVDGLLEQARCDDSGEMIEKIRAYLLWDYIARNIHALYDSYDLVREMTLHELEKLAKK